MNIFVIVPDQTVCSVLIFAWFGFVSSKGYFYYLQIVIGTHSFFSLQLGRGGGEQDSGRASHAELTVTDKHCRFQLTEVQAQTPTPLDICLLVAARIYAVCEKKIDFEYGTTPSFPSQTFCSG